MGVQINKLRYENANDENRKVEELKKETEELKKELKTTQDALYGLQEQVLTGSTGL